MVIFPAILENGCMDERTFADRLRATIDATPGLTAAGLARAAGMDNSSIRQLLSGKAKNPRLDTAMKICAALGTSIEDFMGGDRPALEAQFLELAAQLTDAERQVLEASLKAMIESRNRVPE